MLLSRVYFTNGKLKRAILDDLCESFFPKDLVGGKQKIVLVDDRDGFLKSCSESGYSTIKAEKNDPQYLDKIKNFIYQYADKRPITKCESKTKDDICLAKPSARKAMMMKSYDDLFLFNKKPTENNDDKDVKSHIPKEICELIKYFKLDTQQKITLWREKDKIADEVKLTKCCDPERYRIEVLTRACDTAGFGSELVRVVEFQNLVPYRCFHSFNNDYKEEFVRAVGTSQLEIESLKSNAEVMYVVLSTLKSAAEAEQCTIISAEQPDDKAIKKRAF